MTKLSVLILSATTFAGCVGADDVLDETLASDTAEVGELSCGTATPQDNISVAIPFGSQSKTSPATYDNPHCRRAWVVVVSGAPLDRVAEASLKVTLTDGLPTNRDDCLNTYIVVRSFGILDDGGKLVLEGGAQPKWKSGHCELEYNNSSAYTVGNGGFSGSRMRLQRLVLQGLGPDGTLRKVTAKITAGPSL